jgi:hypothetical protein
MGYNRNLGGKIQVFEKKFRIFEKIKNRSRIKHRTSQWNAQFKVRPEASCVNWLTAGAEETPGRMAWAGEVGVSASSLRGAGDVSAGARAPKRRRR